MTKQLKAIVCGALSIIVLATALIPLDTSYAYVSDEFDGYEEGREYSTSELYDIEFRTNKLGLYGMTIESHEIPSNEWLTFISHDYFPYTTLSDQAEVDNTAPSAVYSAQGIVKVDVVFALGELSQSDAFQDYIPHLTSYIESAANNIDAKVEQVETSTIDVTNQDPSIILTTWEAWKQYPNDPTTTWSYIPEDRSIQDNEYHCHRQGYVDRINDTEGDFILSADIVGYKHSYNDFYGLTFRHGTNGSHYAVVYQDVAGSRCGMYTGQLTTGVTLVKASSHSEGRAIATYNCPAWNLGQYWNLRVAMTGNKIEVYLNDKLIITYTDNSPYLTGNYGVVSVSHGSGRFKNISLTKGATKTLGEAIQDVSWRDGATRFVIHATDVIPPEFDIENPDRENDYAYTVAKLNNCNAYLINLGTNLNKDVLNQLVEAIKEANGTEKGTFFNNNPIITAMDNSANYIISIAKQFKKPVDWILVNTEILWNTIYKDAENDPPLNLGEHNGQNAQPQDTSDIALGQSYGLGNAGSTLQFSESKILAERWRYRHYNNFFDNSPVQVSWHEVWMEDPVSIFEYPGKYRINYKRRDNPLYPSVDLSDPFDSYRYWSTDYDYAT